MSKISLSKEQIELDLIELISKEKLVSIKALSNKIGISPRTLKRKGIDIRSLIIKCGLIPAQKGTPKHSTESLTQVVKSLVKSEGKFLSLETISKKLNIRPATFWQYKVDTRSICEEFGFSKGTVWSWTEDRKEKELQQLVLKYVNLIQDKKRVVSFNEFAKSIGRDPAGLKRRGINPVEIHELCGLEYKVIPDYPDKKDIIESCKKVIISKGRYVTTAQLVDELKIPDWVIRNACSIVDLNLNCGFSRKGFGFEDAVYELLLKIFPNLKIIRQKTFEECRSSSGKLLYFDFYVPELNLAIEADGPQHFNINHKWYSDLGINRDDIKNKYCKMTGINLKRLNYVTTPTIEWLKTELSGIPLKHSVGQPAAKLEEIQEGSETIRKE